MPRMWQAAAPGRRQLCRSTIGPRWARTRDIDKVAAQVVARVPLRHHHICRRGRAGMDEAGWGSMLRPSRQLGTMRGRAAPRAHAPER